MKYKRTMIFDNEGASAEYLNKQISDTQIENMLANIDKKIHQVSNSPDFTDEAFGTSSGVAM
jgi:SPP1 family phage portal protein